MPPFNTGQEPFKPILWNLRKEFPEMKRTLSQLFSTKYLRLMFISIIATRQRVYNVNATVSVARWGDIWHRGDLLLIKNLKITNSSHVSTGTRKNCHKFLHWKTEEGRILEERLESTLPKKPSYQSIVSLKVKLRLARILRTNSNPKTITGEGSVMSKHCGDPVKSTTRSIDYRFTF